MAELVVWLWIPLAFSTSCFLNMLSVSKMLGKKRNLPPPKKAHKYASYLKPRQDQSFCNYLILKLKPRNRQIGHYFFFPNEPLILEIIFLPTCNTLKNNCKALRKASTCRKRLNLATAGVVELFVT